MEDDDLNIKKAKKLKHPEGIYTIGNSDYHRSPAISRSMLMDFKKNPSYYWYKYFSSRFFPESPTPAMNLGSAVHTLTLEKDKFDSDFFVIQQKSRPIRGTAPYSKMMDEANGKIILTRDEYIKAFGISKAILDNPDAAALISDSSIEQSIFFKHKPTDMMCKVRPDIWQGALVCDLKTSADAGYKAFQSSCVNYGYFLQAGMMHYGLNAIGKPMDKFVFIVAEKDIPYAVAIYILSDDALEFGINQFHMLMDRLAQCITNNKWPGYGINELKLPRWAAFDEIVDIE